MRYLNLFFTLNLVAASAVLANADSEKDIVTSTIRFIEGATEEQINRSGVPLFPKLLKESIQSLNECRLRIINAHNDQEKMADEALFESLKNQLLKSTRPGASYDYVPKYYHVIRKVIKSSDFKGVLVGCGNNYRDAHFYHRKTPEAIDEKNQGTTHDNYITISLPDKLCDFGSDIYMDMANPKVVEIVQWLTSSARKDVKEVFLECLNAGSHTKIMNNAYRMVAKGGRIFGWGNTFSEWQISREIYDKNLRKVQEAVMVNCGVIALKCAGCKTVKNIKCKDLHNRIKRDVNCWEGIKSDSKDPATRSVTLEKVVKLYKAGKLHNIQLDYGLLLREGWDIEVFKDHLDAL